MHGVETGKGETMNKGKVFVVQECFKKDEKGHPIKGIKRHPTVGDNVIIYSNASILGEKAVIGDDAVIGGNVWITSKIPPETIVTVKPPELKVSKKTKTQQI